MIAFESRVESRNPPLPTIIRSRIRINEEHLHCVITHACAQHKPAKPHMKLERSRNMVHNAISPDSEVPVPVT